LGKPFFTTTDGALLVALPLLLPVSWGVPEGRWPGVCGYLSRLAEAVYVPRREKTARDIVAALGDRSAVTPQEILRELSAEMVLSLLLILRGKRPGAQAPRFVLEGEEHIEASRAAGKPLIFWISVFIHADLLAKVALRHIGVQPYHLSRVGHGLSPSRFGIGVLNRIQLGVEDRYLEGRVFIDPADPGAALRVLESKLRAGHAVSFMAARPRSKGSAVTVKLLASELAIAPGAAVLARRTGAALLPVFATRVGQNRYRVAIGADLAADGPSTVEQLVRDFASAQEPEILRNPGQWRGWFQF